MAIFKRDMVDINLETGNIHRSFLSHAIGMKDNAADHFGIRVYRDGEPVSLTGVSVQGIFMPPQGDPIAITTGNIISGNEAEVVLPQACYNYDGNFTLAIKLVGGGVTGTMRIVDGVVSNTHASGTVAPTQTVPTYQEILAVYEEMVDSLEGMEGFKKAFDYSILCRSNARMDWNTNARTVSLTNGYLIVPGAFYHITNTISASYTNFQNETVLYYDPDLGTLFFREFTDPAEGVAVARFYVDKMLVGGLYEYVYLNDEPITPAHIYGGMSEFYGKTEDFYNYKYPTNYEVDAGYTWIIGKTMPVGVTLKDITVYTSDNTQKTFYISLWDMTTGTRYKNIELTMTPIYKEVVVTLMEKITVPTRIGFYSAANFTTTSSKTGELIYRVPYNETTFANIHEISNWCLNTRITTYDTDEDEIAVIKKEIHVGPGLDYEEIQLALDSLVGNYATIIVHPKNTPYSRFSMMRKLNESYPWEGLSNVKHISIIGVDKAKCVIQSNTGNYNTPPAEIATNGIIQNLTFISTHTASDGTETAGSYAVHVDNRPADANGMKLEFDNCDFVSYQAAAVGLGLYKNQDILFKNCRLKSITDPTWKPNNSYNSAYMCELGAFFMHTTMGYAGGNMFIRFNDCFLYHEGGTHSMWLKDEDTVKTAKLEATGNTMWCVDSSTTDVLNQLNLMPYNHGNNAANLNS